MKKYISVLLLLCLIMISAAGCTKSETPQSDGKKTETEKSSEVTGKTDDNNKDSNADKSTNNNTNSNANNNTGSNTGSNTDNIGDGNTVTQEKSAASENVDVDLTVLSSTVVYGEVYNIMTQPDEYMGKTIKMSGSYYAAHSDETNQYYHYIIIADAAACCQQGLEFIWSGDHKYPEDYPKDETKAEVIGVFSSYEELGHTYYYLAVNNITLL